MSNISSIGWSIQEDSRTWRYARLIIAVMRCEGIPACIVLNSIRDFLIAHILINDTRITRKVQRSMQLICQLQLRAALQHKITIRFNINCLYITNKIFIFISGKCIFLCLEIAQGYHEALLLRNSLRFNTIQFLIPVLLLCFFCRWKVILRQLYNSAIFLFERPYPYRDIFTILQWFLNQTTAICSIFRIMLLNFKTVSIQEAAPFRLTGSSIRCHILRIRKHII